MGQASWVRITLVANPGSGRDTDPDALAAALRARGAEVDPHPIDDVASAERSARESDRLVVAGGDGSIGLCARAAARTGVPLAVVPTGTANDFARAMGIPLDHERALDIAADAGLPTTRAEVLRAGDRPFVNAASTGLAVVAAHRARPLKPKLGPLAYAVGGVRAGLTADPIALRVRVDGDEAFAGEAWHVIVGGTGAFGGGSRLGRTDTADEQIDVAIVERGSRLALVRRAWGMRTGTLEDQSGVLHLRGRHVEMDVPAGTEFNVDGEICPLQPVVFDVDEGGVNVVVPR
jgi:diacylglycerol kinase family enzyme